MAASSSLDSLFFLFFSFPLFVFLLVSAHTKLEGKAGTCRFANEFSAQELLESATARDQFLSFIAQAEGQFHQDGVGFDYNTGYTFDGHMLDYNTGLLLPGGLHNFSAPSKESLHIGMLTLALAGNEYAAQFVASGNSTTKHELRFPYVYSKQDVVTRALDILERKISTYEKFAQELPGFGGFMPWVEILPNGVYPTSDWQDPLRVPALDNGEMIWAMYACTAVLSHIGQSELASRFDGHLALMAANAQMIFYRGNGNIAWVATIKNGTAAPSPSNYEGEGTPGDPYEGELFSWFLDLKTSWSSQEEREAQWVAKRAMLKAVNYTSSLTGQNITVQRGFWYSSHENWKLSMLPYLSLPLTKTIFSNCERARTLHSEENSVPGMYACVNDVTAGPGLPIPDYVSNTGIPSLAYLTDIAWREDIITPYSIFPTALVNSSVALVWYHNMLLGPRMQGPFGSTEAVLINGSNISPLLTWDSKITGLFGLLGGTSAIAQNQLEAEGLFSRFEEVVVREYTLAFGSMLGDQDGGVYGLPSVQIPTNILGNFTGC